MIFRNLASNFVILVSFALSIESVMAEIVWGSTVDIAGTSAADDASIVSSSDGQKVVALWRQTCSGCFSHVQTRASSDAGATWGATATLSPTNDGGSHADNPQIAMSSDGNRVTVVYEHASYGGIKTHSSSDGGNTWSAVTLLSEIGNNERAEFPRVAMSSDGSKITIVWQIYSDSYEKKIQARSSTDGGNSWGSTYDLSVGGADPEGDAAEHPDITTSANGTSTTVVWQNYDFGTPNPPYAIKSRTSSDSGASWSAAVDVSISDHNLAYPAIAGSDDGARLNIVWRCDDGPGGDSSTRLICSSRSSNSGSSWAAGTQLSSTGSQPPAVVASSDGSKVSVSWGHGDGYINNSPKDTIQVRSSSDFGANWNSPVQVSPSDNSFASEYNPSSGIMAASSAGNPIIVWLTVEGSNYVVKGRRSVDNGNTWDPIFDLGSGDGGTGDPVIAISADGSKVSALWFKYDNAAGSYTLQYRNGVVPALPDPPSGLSASPSDAQVTISFTAGNSNGAAITNYAYSTDGTNYTILNPADATSPITITGLTNGATYSIRLKAINSVGQSPASSAVSVTLPNVPDAPTGLSASAGNGSATISFTPGNSNGASITNYAYSTDGTNYTALNPADPTSPINISGLNNGTTYSIRLKAINSLGYGPASAAVSVTPSLPVSAPDAPTGLSASSGDGQVTISFTAGNNNGAAITNYAYSTDGTNYTTLNPADATSPITITGLTNGTTYSIRLKAINSAGQSPASSAVSVAPTASVSAPDAPTGLSATPGDREVTISFTAGNGNGATITNYAYSLDGSSFSNLNPADAMSPITITGLTNGTTYSIRLKAINSAGQSPASSAISVTLPNVPDAPTGLSASAGNNRVTISFTEGNSNGAAITNYAYSLNGSSYTNLSPADATSPITITGLTNGTTYSIRLKAINFAGQSPASSAISATPRSAPDAPTGLSASSGDGEVTISFNAGNSNGASITNYAYNTTGSELNAYRELNPADASSPVTITGLTNGKTYSIRLKAINSVGQSPASNTVSAAPTSSVSTPDAPTGLLATPGDREVTISFTAGNGNGATITNYAYSLNGSSYNNLSPADATSPITITGLINGTTYSIRLKAINSEGQSPASSAVSVTPAPVVSVPDAPTGLSASPGDGEVTISFTEGSSNGAAITNYAYSLDGSGYNNLSPADATSPITITGLTNGTTYSIRLKAINSEGQSPASSTVSVTPEALVKVPDAPTRLKASFGDGEVTISFTAGNDNGATITNYSYSTGDTYYTPLNPEDSTSPITITGLTNDVTYTITLKAINSVGESIPSNPVYVTPNQVGFVPAGECSKTQADEETRSGTYVFRLENQDEVNQFRARFSETTPWCDSLPGILSISKFEKCDPNTQLTVDSGVACQVGGLLAMPAPVSDLTPLSWLRGIDSLEVVETDLETLQGLQSITGSIEVISIQNNSNLTTLSSLSGLSTFDRLSDDEFLLDPAFETLTITPMLFLQGNPLLTSINGIPHNVNSNVRMFIYIADNRPSLSQCDTSLLDDSNVYDPIMSILALLVNQEREDGTFYYPGPGILNNGFGCVDLGEVSEYAGAQRYQLSASVTEGGYLKFQGQKSNARVTVLEEKEITFPVPENYIFNEESNPDRYFKNRYTKSNCSSSIESSYKFKMLRDCSFHAMFVPDFDLFSDKKTIVIPGASCKATDGDEVASLQFRETGITNASDQNSVSIVCPLGMLNFDSVRSGEPEKFQFSLLFSESSSSSSSNNNLPVECQLYRTDLFGGEYREAEQMKLNIKSYESGFASVHSDFYNIDTQRGRMTESDVFSVKCELPPGGTISGIEIHTMSQ